MADMNPEQARLELIEMGRLPKDAPMPGADNKTQGPIDPVFTPKQQRRQQTIDDITQQTIGGLETTPKRARDIIGDIYTDAEHSLNTLPDEVSRIVSDAPEAGKRARDYGSEHPIKAVGQTGLGALEGIAGILSAQAEARKYLSKKIYGEEKPQTELQKVMNRTPYEALQSVEDAAGLDRSQGQEYRTLGGLIPSAVAGKTLPGLGAPAIVSQTAGEKDDPIHALAGVMAIRLGANLKKAYQGDKAAYKNFKSELRDAQKEYKLSNEDTAKLEDYMTKTYKSKSVPALESKQEDLKSNITKQKEIADKPLTPFNPEEPVNEGVNLEKALEDTHSKTQEHLFANQEPDVIASKGTVSNFERDYKNVASNIYDEIPKDLKGSSLVVPDNLHPKSELTQVLKSLEQSGWGTEEAAKLKGQLEKAIGDKEISANDFYQAFRTTRQTASKTRNNAYKHGNTATEFDDLIAKANKLEAHATSMEKVLEKTEFGGPVLKKLKEANKIWKTVKQVENNSLYKGMAKKELMSGDLIKKLRGAEEGHDTLNKIIQSDPDLLRAAFGTKYNASKGSLLNLNDRETQLLGKMPELDSLIKEMHLNTKAIKTEKETAPARKKKYGELEKKFTEKLKAKEDVPNLIKEYVKLDKDLNELKDKLRRSKNTDKKITEILESKINKVKKRRQQVKNTIKKAGLYAAGSMAGGGILKIISSLL